MRTLILGIALAAAVGCGAGSRLPDAGPADADVVADDAADVTADADVAVADVAAEAPGDAPAEVAPARVHGWILLEADRDRVLSAIEEGAKRGVNHVQLSHDLIDEVDQLLGDSPEAAARAALLNEAIAAAHAHGMKAYVWAHELSGVGPDVCYGPDGDVWKERADAYRAAIARIPDVDGVVLMFGSAPVPPWFTFCSCRWCLDRPADDPFEMPPRAEKARLIVEHVAAVVTGELHKEVIARVFVHEPEENAWHAEGFAAADADFATMHKGPTQDWQPYNPHDPTVGACGPRPAIMEEDAAGEYLGLSALPFAAPGYYLYRLRHVMDRGGLGAVLRVERGSRRAIGTPNDVNLLAVARFLADPAVTLDEIWSEFLADRYGIGPATPGFRALRSALESSFPVRLKDHYVLGIWALDKGSDLPRDLAVGELHGRGNMPKWDPAWQATWDAVDRPDATTLRRLWQEGSESVWLASEALAAFAAVEGLLSADARADLGRRLAHQRLAARAWRAADQAIFANRARGLGDADPGLVARMAWARDELLAVEAAMRAEGLDGVAAGSPSAAAALAAAVAGSVPEGTVPWQPDAPPFSPIRVARTTGAAPGPAGAGPGAAGGTAVLVFSAPAGVEVTVDWGTDLAVLGRTIVLPADRPAAAEERVVLQDLLPGVRYVARARAAVGGVEHVGGETWIFAEAACAGPACPACTPDCTGLCAGAPDGCGGACAGGDCRGTCVGSACLETEL